MKTTVILLLCSIILLSCGDKKSATESAEVSALTENTVSEPVDTTKNDTIDSVQKGETLNDIRFAGWGKEQWIDNEYIRTVRKYIDAYNNGEIEDATLYEYKDYIQGKFILGDIQPWMAGGALIYIIFCDNPEKMFYSIVYSHVNTQTREIYDYECRGLRLETDESGCTKEDIIQFLEECPEYKMW